MDPQSTPQVPLPEQRPVGPQSEALPDQTVPEQAPARIELAPQLGQSPASLPPVVSATLPSVTLPSTPVTDPATMTPAPIVHGTVGAGPVIADDVDVIEKEWVDQTNSVIKATSQDPYIEEEALEDLQVDYLKKRYGKDIKKDQTDKNKA